MSLLDQNGKLAVMNISVRWESETQKWGKLLTGLKGLQGFGGSCKLHTKDLKFGYSLLRGAADK